MLQGTHLGYAGVGRDAPVHFSLSAKSSIADAAALEGHHAVPSNPALPDPAVGACAQRFRSGYASLQRLQQGFEEGS